MTGVDEDLAAAVTALYTGDAVALGPMASALEGRASTSGDVSVTGAEGVWFDRPIALLTAGDDVTLAVKEDVGWTVVGGWWPSLGIAEPQLGGRRHIAMLGSDARQGEGERVERSRCDGVQIVSLDGEGAGGVLSIARDLWVTTDQGRDAKINAAMVFGGPESQVATMANTAGFPIEGYVLIGMDSLIDFVDQLGGVEVDSPYALPKYEIGVGRVLLNGYRALWFSRERKSAPGGDFGRSANQGLLLKGFGMLARNQGPLKLPTMLATASRFTQTNLSAAQALTFGAAAFVTDPAKVGMKLAKGPFGTRSGQSVVLLGDEARAHFDDMADGNLTP